MRQSTAASSSSRPSSRARGSASPGSQAILGSKASGGCHCASTGSRAHTCLKMSLGSKYFP
eukprot:scaffold703_cov245-Pinguiococcus_pyrenoidosus.AAC.5